MHLAVISHKVVWESVNSPSGYATDGGFPFQIKAISELFGTTTLVVPSGGGKITEGIAPLSGKELRVTALESPNGRGLWRKLGFPVWLIRNGWTIWKEIGQADAVHAPIPGDVGTIGMVIALLRRKPLFVRHCGNWFIQRTVAERFWKWSMEYFGGGKNVMLATGGAAVSPSSRNKNIKWIFSTSLRSEEIEGSRQRTLPESGNIRLVIACRQESRKGTDVVVKSMPEILKTFPNVSLDVIGDGTRLPEWKALAERLGLNGSIRFYGKVEHAEVLSLLKQAHIFCFPTSASEGFPKVVLEALASGIPVVTTRVSVLPQLLGSGGGVLLEDSEPSSLAKAVIEICSDMGRYEDMSAKALDTARQYSLEAWQDYLSDILCPAWRVSSLS
jgi:glycosyltransferase involved in cell wall biosynthesis